MHMPPTLNSTGKISRWAFATQKLHRPAAWIIALLLLDLAALGDVVTGTDLWFGPVYLFVMCASTWLLGWRPGYAIAICCMLLTFSINGAALYPYGSELLSWDLALRFVALSFLIFAIAAVRGAFLREWWMARTEPLTGALNRQAFFEFAENVSTMNSWRLMIYVDLDGLKYINDTHGHAAGDGYLKTFAENMRTNIRHDDIFARMGGDEFTVFMAVRDESCARAVAVRLHTAINNIPGGMGCEMRCSMGALLVPPGQVLPEALLQQSDALMYAAKTKGAGLKMDVADMTKLPVGSARADRPLRPTPMHVPTNAPSANSSLAERRRWLVH